MSSAMIHLEFPQLYSYMFSTRILHLEEIPYIGIHLIILSVISFRVKRLIFDYN